MEKSVVIPGSILVILLVLVGLVYAAGTNGMTASATKFLVTVQPSATQKVVSLPASASKVSEDFFYLGSKVIEGETVEGYAVIDYLQQTSKESQTPASTCFNLIAEDLRWHKAESYVLDSTNLDGLSDSFVAETFAEAVDSWDSQVKFHIFKGRNVFQTVDGPDFDAPDGKNEVMFRGFAPGVLAVTVFWGTFSGPPGQRKIIEWDHVYNDIDYNWGDAGPTDETNLGDTSVIDFKNVATHELGHSAGLHHSPGECTEETMYAFAQVGETKKRTLNAGDIAGIQSLYH